MKAHLVKREIGRLFQFVEEVKLSHKASGKELLLRRNSLNESVTDNWMESLSNEFRVSYVK
jgi:hypothetical protein